MFFKEMNTSIQKRHYRRVHC